MLIFFTSLRLLLMINIYLNNIKYSSVKISEIQQMFNYEPNLLFVVKCLIKNTPYKFFLSSLTVSILYFVFLIRLAELPLAVKLEGETFQNFTTTIWMVMITMTTVGYGDYYPKTLPGRFIGFFLCIWGIFLMSMIVIILFQSLELSYEEK